MKKKKILFIIQSYPSERSANVLCDEKIMMRLYDSGEYEIHCLTYQYDWQPMQQEINGFKVFRFKKSFFWDVYTKARHNSEKRWAQAVIGLQRLSLRIKQIVTIPIYPCYEPINAVLYARAAIKLHKKEKYDAVFAEHNGYDCLYAGYRLKEYDERITFIATLWDPFTGKQLPKYLPRKYSQLKNEKSESHLLAHADRIIVMKSSQNYHMLYSKDKPYFHRYCFFDIPGIFRPKDCNQNDDQFTKKGYINLLYAGLIYLPDRNPTFLIDIIDSVDFGKPINCIFLCAGNGVKILSDLSKKSKMTITIHPYVSKEELGAVMNNVDGFLNIGGATEGMVPSKIFEYMSYGKPIISTFLYENDASREYMERYPAGICLNSHDFAESKKELMNFVKNSFYINVPFEVVENSFFENTPDAYFSLIDGLLKEKKL